MDSGNKMDKKSGEWTLERKKRKKFFTSLLFSFFLFVLCSFLENKGFSYPVISRKALFYLVSLMLKTIKRKKFFPNISFFFCFFCYDFARPLSVLLLFLLRNGGQKKLLEPLHEEGDGGSEGGRRAG